MAQALHRDGPASHRGRLVADAGKRDWDELTAEYGAMLMEGLGVMGTRGKHVNVLQHLMGYLKNHLSSEDRATCGRLELLGLIKYYRQGLVPLIVPLTRLKHPLSRSEDHAIKHRSKRHDPKSAYCTV